MRTHQLPLLPTCVLPGCQQPVTTIGEPCGDCRRAFGAMLRHQPHGQPLTAEETNARDHHIRQAYRQQRDQLAGADDLRRNQTLLAVHRTPHLHRTSAGWECDRCQTLK